MSFWKNVHKVVFFSFFLSKKYTEIFLLLQIPNLNGFKILKIIKIVNKKYKNHSNKTKTWQPCTNFSFF